MGAEWYFNKFYHLVKDGWEPPQIRERIYGFGLTGGSEPLVKEWSKDKIGYLLSGEGSGSDVFLSTEVVEFYRFPFDDWSAYTKCHSASLSSGGFTNSDDGVDYVTRTTDWEYTDDGTITADGSYTDTWNVDYDPDTGFDTYTTRSGTEPTGNEVGSRSDTVTFSTTVASKWDDFWSAFDNATLTDSHFTETNRKAWRNDNDDSPSERRVRYKAEVSIPMSAWIGYYESLSGIAVEWDELELPESDYDDSFAAVTYNTLLTDDESKYSNFGMAVDVGIDDLPWVMGTYDFYNDSLAMGTPQAQLTDTDSTTAPKLLRISFSSGIAAVTEDTRYGLILYEPLESVDLDIYFLIVKGDGSLDEYESTITITPTPGERVADFSSQAVAEINNVIAGLSQYDGTDFGEISIADSSLSAGLVGKGIAYRHRGILKKPVGSNPEYYKQEVRTFSAGKDSGLTGNIEADLTVKPVENWDKKDVFFVDNRSGRTPKGPITNLVISDNITGSAKLLTTAAEYSIKASQGNEKGIDSIYVKLGDKKFILRGVF